MSTEQITVIGNNARDYVVEFYDFVPIAQKYTDVLKRALDEWNSSKVKEMI